MEYEDTVGWIATGCRVPYYFSLIIPFFNVLRGKLCYDDAPISLINTIYVDCLSLYFYSEKMNSDPLGVCHKGGAILCVLLIIIYLIFEAKRYKIDAFLNLIILILGTLVIKNRLKDIIEKADNVGRICAIVKIISFYNPALDIWRIIKEKDYLDFSLLMSITLFISSLGWGYFGHYINDVYLLAPNIIGGIISIIQIIAYYYAKSYFKKYIKPFCGTGIEIDGKKEHIDIDADDNNINKGKPRPVKIISKLIN